VKGLLPWLTPLLSLNLVERKIPVIAEENLFLDNFMSKLEEARREFLDAPGDDKSSMVPRVDLIG
jgi:hypothetical protein